MVIKTIEIDGKPVQFKVSAAIPRYYRFKFRRDIIVDMRGLMNEIERNKDGDSHISITSLEIFENIAYIMAKYADPGIPDSIDEWLDNFETFSIYKILPQLFELWGLNMETQIESKKKFA